MFKKFFQIFLLVGISTSLTANNCNPCDPCGPCDPCEPCPPCEFCPPAPPADCAYNAPYVYDVSSCLCWDIYLTGSFLWWQAIEEGLEIGLISTEGNQSLPITNGSIAEIDFKYKPGFKVGLGFDIGCDNWEFYTEYTRYHAQLSGSGSAPDNGVGNFYSFWVHPNIEEVASNASATWNLDMDYVDFTLRREFYVGKCLTFRPLLGIRAAWIDQKYKTTVNGVGTPSYNASDIVTVTNTSDSWAVGVATGMHTKWFFCNNFRVFGNFLTAILYTDYDLKAEQRYTNSAGVVDPVDSIDFKQSPKYLRPNMELSLGAGWGDYFCCNDYYFDLALSYDFNVFWNQNVFRKFLDDLNVGTSFIDGDLFIHGLNVAARLHF